MVVDAASKTSGRPKLLGDHQQPFADHRKPPGKRVVVGGRREVVDVILWQPVIDHRQTFADLRQPPATTPKIVVVRGRRLVVAVVAIVWPSLYLFGIRLFLSFLVPSSLCLRQFQIRHGVERIFRLKSTLSHFRRGSGGALWTSRPAPVSKLTGVGRSPLDITAGAVRVSVNDQWVCRCPPKTRPTPAGTLRPTSCLRPPMCVAVTGCTWQPSKKHHVDPVK